MRSVFLFLEFFDFFSFLSRKREEENSLSLFPPPPPPFLFQLSLSQITITKTTTTTKSPLQATIFFGSFVAGSLFDTAALWAKDPAAGVRSLGLSAPTMSSFFLNYVAIKALFAPAFKNLRLVPFIIFAIRSKLSATERSKARLWSEQYQIYGVEVPQLTMVLLLGLVFSSINPLLPPTCLLYFLVVLFFQKYRVMYVARPSYQTGGELQERERETLKFQSFFPSSFLLFCSSLLISSSSVSLFYLADPTIPFVSFFLFLSLQTKSGMMWQQIFDQIMTALFLLQIIMFGFLSIKRSPAAVAVLVLIPITILARSAVASVFREPLRAMSLRSAVDVDGKDAQKLSSGGPSSSSLSSSTTAKAANGAVAVDPSAAASKLYVSPAMAFDGSDLVELKKEAASVEAILAGKAPPPLLPDDGALEATKDAASEAEFQKKKTIKKQVTMQSKKSKRASSASSSRQKAAAPAAAAAAPAAAPAAAAPRSAAASTTTEDVEAAAAPFVAPPAPVIGPPRGNGDAV